ncbi:MAG: hypothetical protein N2Z74_09515, partial [Syntrophales bacterium]|nr:hypothetical protein [Syntrophales bacterium]
MKGLRKTLYIVWAIGMIGLFLHNPNGWAAPSGAYPSLADLVDRLSPAVVNISTTATIRTSGIAPGNL